MTPEPLSAEEMARYRDICFLTEWNEDDYQFMQSCEGGHRLLATIDALQSQRGTVDAVFINSASDEAAKMNTPDRAKLYAWLEAWRARYVGNGHVLPELADWLTDDLLAALPGLTGGWRDAQPKRNHASELLSKLVAAIEAEAPHFTLRKIIREGAPILHCNPPFETMSPESKGALVSIVTAAQDMFAKPKSAPPPTEE